MGFNRRRKIEDQRRQAAEKEAAEHRATDAQVLEDAECLIAAWNERQAKRMPMLFSPTIGAAITAGYWLLWVRALPGLPHHERHRSAYARPSPRQPFGVGVVALRLVHYGQIVERGAVIGMVHAKTRLDGRRVLLRFRERRRIIPRSIEFANPLMNCTKGDQVRRSRKSPSPKLAGPM
jgi:hypothetical protein